MLAFFVLAQTMTAIPASGAGSFDELKTQFWQAVSIGVIGVVTAGLAWLKTWLRAKLAEKLTKVAITGVENSSRAIETALVAHLGPQGVVALAKVGINLDALRDRLVKATKDSVQAVAIGSDVEEKLAPIVAKVTTERPAVDGDGNPIQK